MASEYSQDQSRSELDEPRRTTDQVKSGDEFGMKSQEDSSQQRQSGSGYGGGYGGVNEEEPPHHKLHSDDEPLPKPAPGTFDDAPKSGEGFDQQYRDTEPAKFDEGFGDAPKSTEQYRDTEPAKFDEGFGDPPKSTEQYHDTEPTKFDEGPVQAEPRGMMGTGEMETNESRADPSEAFPGAPVDRKVEEPGYGYDQKTSEPTSMVSPTSETGTPKKEGLMTKIKEKLPGHHKPAGDDTTMEHHDTTGAAASPPKKGLMTKIKEKLPGHHSSATNTAE